MREDNRQLVIACSGIAGLPAATAARGVFTGGDVGDPAYHHAVTAYRTGSMAEFDAFECLDSTEGSFPDGVDRVSLEVGH